MKTDFEIIQENINSMEFNFLIGDVFSCDNHLNEIAKYMNKNKWFFTTKEIKAANDFKKIIANYKNDRKKVIDDNNINEQVNTKNSTIFKRDLSHNPQKYNKNYLIPLLNNAYLPRLIKKEKIKPSFNTIKNSLKKKDEKYKEQVKKLIRNSKLDNKIKKRIKSLIPILDTLNQKDFKEAIKVFNKNKDKQRLIKTLTNKKIFHYYVPVYNIESDEKNIKLNEFIEIVDISDFRKKFNKYQLYDTFIDIMRNSLYAKTKLVHFKISCVGENKSFDLFKRYYELFIDIISFLQSTLTIELDISQKRFFYFKINKKYILPASNHETTLISYWEIYKETKKYFKSFTFLFKENLDGISSKILNTLKYKRKAEFSIFKEDKLLYYIIALESLVLDASDWKSKKRKDLLIIKKINNLITYYPEFKDLPKKIEEMYKLRNRIVHTGKHIIRINEEDLRYLSRTIISIIGIYLSKKRYRHLSSMINKIKNEKEDFYNREKERLTKLCLSLNKSYSLKGELFQNKNKLCDIKAKIKIKDFKDDCLLDAVLEDIKLRNIPSHLQGTSIDKFYIKGNFRKFKIEKTEVFFTIRDLIILSGRELPFPTIDNKHKIYRLNNTLNINKAD
jgi:hypothetical protein